MNSVRITRRVGEHLMGTQAYYDVGGWVGSPANPNSREDPETLSLMRKLHSATFRKDGSVTLDLTDLELVVLREYVEGLATVGSDNAWDPDGLADLNAARACLRQIAALIKEA